MASVTRKPDSQTLHDQWVSAIAKDRFAFPNDQHPTWKRYANPGSEKNLGIVLDDGSAVYPDIVVQDTAKAADDVAMVAEVETAESVVDSEVSQWRDYSRCVFYLYIPRGLCDNAKKLAKGVAVNGFREYWVENDKNRYTEC